VLLENVRGLAAGRFDGYRERASSTLRSLGYHLWWQAVQASDYGVPQLRPRFVLVALRPPWAGSFRWPEPLPGPAPTVGDTLHDLMQAHGWPGAPAWRAGAQQIAPTIVGGSKKHGGPDLGPTRARAAWRALGVDGLGVADRPPGPDFPASQPPKLTVRMVARLQGFPLRPVSGRPVRRPGRRSRRGLRRPAAPSRHPGGAPAARPRRRRRPRPARGG
jgi:DNA (cytosine-5)-methyltransferase 1